MTSSEGWACKAIENWGVSGVPGLHQAEFPHSQARGIGHNLTVMLLRKMGPWTNSSHFGQSSDSPQPLDSLAQGLPALGIVLFSYLSYIPLNYICSYLYTCLYNVARFPSLYIDLAPLPYLIPFNIIHRSSSLGVFILFLFLFIQV